MVVIGVPSIGHTLYRSIRESNRESLVRLSTEQNLGARDSKGRGKRFTSVRTIRSCMRTITDLIWVGLSNRLESARDRLSTGREIGKMLN